MDAGNNGGKKGWMLGETDGGIEGWKDREKEE